LDTINVLKTRICPNCSEPNKRDSRFCAKCRMVLSYDTYTNSIEEKQEQGDAISALSDAVMKLAAEVEELKVNKMNSRR
jgi:predicted amidophosphoribosyltransferase